MPVRSRPTFIDIRLQGFLRKKRGRDVLRAIEEGMVDAAVQAIPTVEAFTPEYRGLLKGSYAVNFRKGPRRALIVSSSPPEKVATMEEGRRPGARFPPPGPITAWVAATINPPAKKLKSVAFLVARKIAQFGIEIPLKVSGLGGMFRRTVAVLGGRFFALIIKLHVDRLK